MNGDTVENSASIPRTASSARLKRYDLHPDYFHYINERPVDEISLKFFYSPHTITLLVCSISFLVYVALTRDDGQSLEENLWAGFLCVVFFFLVISVLAFPNGPFTRPHPAVWRIVFGVSVLYLLTLLFLIFQDYKTVKKMILWLFPDLKDFRIDMEKEYGVNCWDVSLERIWSYIDVFAAGHFFGWVLKAMLVRHYGILWTISVMWEITEIAFAHLLPNFVECWWDALILDVLLCNGLGIYVGMQICKWLEMRDYHWESVKDIRGAKRKLKRCVLQFTPESWTHVRWMDPNCSYMRFLAVCQMVVFWQLTELNTFFIKHIFEMPPGHPLVLIRLTIISLVVAPTVRQYYSYVTDTRCKRVGTQCWVYGAIMCTEALACIKFGNELFARTLMLNILAWLLIQFIFSVVCVYCCVLWVKYGSARRSPATSRPQAMEERRKSKMSDEEDDDEVEKKSRLADMSIMQENFEYCLRNNLSCSAYARRVKRRLREPSEGDQYSNSESDEDSM